MRPEGPPGLVMAETRGELVPMFSRAIVAEHEEVFRRPRLQLEAAKVDAALARMQALGTLIHGDAPPPPANLPDDADWPFIACALGSGCPVITGNVKDFPAWLAVRVMTAREWVDAAV